MKRTMDIAIDASLKRQLDPLTNAEHEHLQQSLLSEGCREAIVVWATNFQLDCCGCSQTDSSRFVISEDESVVCTHCQQVVTRYDAVLIDGHNRYEICEKNGIPLKIKPMLFHSRPDVEDWIDRNQVGKRNLSVEAFRIVTGRIYLRRKRKHGNEGGEQDRRLKHHADVLTNDTHEHTSNAIDTAAEVATELGVSKATVQRNAQRAEVHDRMMLLGDSVAMQAAKSLPQKDITQARRAAKNSNFSLAANLKSLSQLRSTSSTAVASNNNQSSGQDHDTADPHPSRICDKQHPLAEEDVDKFLMRLEISPNDIREKVIRGLLHDKSTPAKSNTSSDSVLAALLSAPPTPETSAPRSAG